MTVEAMINEVPDTLPSSAKSEINELADDLKDNPSKAKELILNNKDLVNKIQESLNDAFDFTQEDIQDYFTVVLFISKYSDLTAKEKQNITAVKNKILAIDYANVYDTKRADISSILLKDNIVGDVQSGWTKHVQNPSQFYPDYLKTYANNDTEQMIFLSLEEKQKAVLDVYKQDMIDTVSVFLKKINASPEYNKKWVNYNIDAIVLMLSKESKWSELYKLAHFLLDAQKPSLQNFNNLSSATIKYNESIEQFMQTIMRLEMWYKWVLRPNGQTDNPDAYIQESSTFAYVPWSFEFYTEDDVLQQMVDFVNNNSAPSNYITFDVQWALHSTYFLTSNGTRREYPTVSGTKFVQPNDPTYDKTTVFLWSYNKESKWQVSKTDYNINLKEYTTWLTFNDKQNTVQSMKEYLEMPKTPLNILHDEIEHVGVDTIKEVQLSKEMYSLYSTKLQALYPTLLIVETDGVDQLQLKDNVSYKDQKVVAEQYFYAWDIDPNDPKTNDIVGQDNISLLQKELSALQSTPGITNIRVKIEWSASHLPYNWEYLNNEWLARARAENAKLALIEPLTWLITSDQIFAISAVNGPDFDRNAWYSQDEIAQMESALYRDHQYVKIKVVYDKVSGWEKKILDLHQTRPVPDLFGFSMKLPPASTKNINEAKKADANKRITESSYGKAYEEVDKKLQSI